MGVVTIGNIIDCESDVTIAISSMEPDGGMYGVTRGA